MTGEKEKHDIEGAGDNAKERHEEKGRKKGARGSQDKPDPFGNLGHHPGARLGVFGGLGGGVWRGNADEGQKKGGKKEGSSCQEHLSGGAPDDCQKSGDHGSSQESDLPRGLQEGIAAKKVIPGDDQGKD